VKKGINLWCFEESTSAADAIRLAKQAGFDSVELNLEEPDLNADGLERFKRLREVARSEGIILSSISTNLHWKYPLTDHYAETRQKGLDIVRRQIEAAHIIGADAVLVVPGRVTETDAYDQVFERAQESIAKVLPEAKSAEVAIGIENVWNRFLLSPLEFRAFIDGFQSPWVRVYFDVGNVVVSGYPEQWIRILGPRIVRVHVKDFVRDAGNYLGFVHLLEGDVAWPAVVQALQEVGYDSFVSAEIPPYPHGWFPDAGVAHISRAMDLILGSHRG